MRGPSIRRAIDSEFHVDAVADGVGAVGAFDLEAELAIERDGAFVVGVDVQLDPAQSQPVVG